MDIFAQASQQKLRFGIGKGSLSVEHLWDLSVEELNAAAVSLDAQIASSGQQGYLRVKSTADSKLILQRDILVYIITYKLDQDDASRNAKLASIEEKELLDLIHEKEKEVKKGKSLEELKAEYNSKYAKH